MLFEEILTSVFEGRFSEVESLTEQQKKTFSRYLHSLRSFCEKTAQKNLTYVIQSVEIRHRRILSVAFDVSSGALL